MENTGILLDSGTNELEIMEFLVGGSSFGINVAKIKEIVRRTDIRPIPYAHPCVEGVISRRGEVLTVIDLASYLGIEKAEDEKDIFLIAHFNNITVVFHVDAVSAIHRVSWSDIGKPDDFIYGGKDGVVTGICKLTNETMLVVLDFEKIINDINPSAELTITDFSRYEERDRSDKPILIAEDSVFLRKLLLQNLIKAGYSNIISATNGLEAWTSLENLKKEAGNIHEKISCVITDIEMPQMDGLRLIKLIKEDPMLKQLPVIVFSSMIDETMSRKCTEVGADAQLSKPEIAKLITCVDEVLKISSETK